MSSPVFKSQIVAAAAVLWLAAASPLLAGPPVDFVRDIQPIFSSRCYKCHGPEKQKSGLRLDLKSAALRGGDDGPVIAPGKPAQSKLIHFIAGDDPEKIMPPKGARLTADQVAMLRAWVDAGAPWPDDAKPAQLTSDLWSLQPVKEPVLPAVKNGVWARNPVDLFVLAKLETAGLAPSKKADRPTLIRRLSYDLLGLPPSPAEIDAFVADKDPKAYENLVDRLLASPHYGERWGRHWLDIARFTESQGFEYDRIRDNAWPYRDYVINAFNDDKPYDRFVMEQVAGDVLEPVTSDSIVATGLLVCGPWDQAGNAQANATQKLITREEEMEDLVSVVGQSLLGLTVNCARCHAHKFDPIPQEDYYRIKSVLDGVKHGERSLSTPEQLKAREARAAEAAAQVAALQKQIAELDDAARKLVAVDKAAGPTPFARWDFTADAADSLGGLHGTLEGGAKIAGGRLILNGQTAFLRTGPIPRDIREKTLEAWLILPTAEQGGGGVISLETGNGSVFDAVVFAEREPRKWVVGSNFYSRTRNLGGMDETPGQRVHVAAVFNADNSIAFYRNGEPYAAAYTPDTPLQTYKAGDAHVLIGKRHTGGGNAFLTAEVEQASLYDRALSADEIAASFKSSGRLVPLPQLLAAMSPEQRARRKTLEKQVQSLRDASAPGIDGLAVAYAGVREQPAPTHRLIRGEVKQPAEVVAPGALSVIRDPSPDFGLAPDAPEAQRRLKLAAWIASPKNPLTARVMLNRLWHYHFGRGIVGTTSDFGASGDRPSHPELLDWLAASFVRAGWSMKAMHRLIVNSATYRQGSAANEKAAVIDADDALLWRFAPRRLEAEAVRDAMLAVSGQLNPAMGGPSFRPFDVSTFGSAFYAIVDKIGPEFNRRTVYRMNVNSGKDPLLEAFDCPEPSVKTPARRTTTTPLQALGLMNNSFVQRQARGLAERVTTESNGDVPKAIALAYRCALGRAPTADELSGAAAVAKGHGLTSVCWALLNSTEFVYVR
jgi:mono/diheme cytochrome c family protein